MTTSILSVGEICWYFGATYLDAFSSSVTLLCDHMLLEQFHHIEMFHPSMTVNMANKSSLAIFLVYVMDYLAKIVFSDFAFDFDLRSETK